MFDLRASLATCERLTTHLAVPRTLTVTRFAQLIAELQLRMEDELEHTLVVSFTTQKRSSFSQNRSRAVHPIFRADFQAFVRTTERAPPVLRSDAPTALVFHL